MNDSPVEEQDRERPIWNKIKIVLLFIAIFLAALVLIFTSISAIGGIGLGLLWFINEHYTSPYCELLANSTPEPPPIYPDSTLVGRRDIYDSEGFFYYELYYTTDDSVQEVMEYFDSTMSEGCNFEVSICRGGAEPVGKYTVSVTDSNPTDFKIGVSLERCQPGWP
jgi:hypothetical protein